MAQEYDYLLKLLIIGDSGVGKSSIMTRFADDKFTGTYISTIGVDFKIRTLNVDGKTVRLQIWDTAGQERFKTITTTFYRGTHGVIVVYDITRMESIVGVKRWLDEIQNNCDGNIKRILVGNKCDRADNRAVPTVDGQVLADQMNIPFLETSAKDNFNIEQVFTIITRLLMASQPSVRSTPSSSFKIRPSSTSTPMSPKKKCC